MGATQTQIFFETRIHPRLQFLNQNIDEWWSDRGLRTNDYSGMSHYTLNHLWEGIVGHREGELNYRISTT